MLQQTIFDVIMSFDEQIRKMVEKEVLDALPGAISKALELMLPSCQSQDEAHIIRGFNNLAKFLQVSVPTARKLKDQKVFPCYQWGRVMVFKSNEVLAGMRARKV